MDLQFVIPSYQRPAVLAQKTLRHLIEAKVPRELITVVVADDAQRAQYEKTVCDGVRIVVGAPGIVPVRNFVQNLFPEGTIVCSIDDDITSFVTTAEPFTYDLLRKMAAALYDSDCGLLGINPTGNPFFMRGEFKTGHYFCVGCLFMFKARKDVVFTSLLDDYERTALYATLDGNVMRYDALSFKTNYFAEGGIGKRSLAHYHAAVAELAERFPTRFRVTTKSNKNNIRLFGQKTINHLRCVKPAPSFKARARKKPAHSDNAGRGPPGLVKALAAEKQRSCN